MDEVVHHCSYPDDEWSILPQCAHRLKEAITHGDKYRTCYPQVPDWADYRGGLPSRPGRVLKPCDRCGECMPYTTDYEWDLRIQAVAKFCASLALCTGPGSDGLLLSLSLSPWSCRGHSVTRHRLARP